MLYCWQDERDPEIWHFGEKVEYSKHYVLDFSMHRDVIRDSFSVETLEALDRQTKYITTEPFVVELQMVIPEAERDVGKKEGYDMTCKAEKMCAGFVDAEKVRKPTVSISIGELGWWVYDDNNICARMNAAGFWETDGVMVRAPSFWYASREIAQATIDHVYPKAKMTVNEEGKWPDGEPHGKEEAKDCEPMERRCGKVRVDSLKAKAKFRTVEMNTVCEVVSFSDTNVVEYHRNGAIVLSIDRNYHLRWTPSDTMVTPLYEGPERRKVTKQAKLTEFACIWVVQRQVSNGYEFLWPDGKWHWGECHRNDADRSFPTKIEAAAALAAWYQSIGRPAK